MSIYKPAEYNPRRITPDEMELLKNSIRNWGDLSGVTINQRTGNLVTGHQRMKAAGYEEGEPFDFTAYTEETDDTGTVGRGRIKTKSGKEFFARVVDWDEETEKLANVAANKIEGKWDYRKLLDEYDEADLAEAGFDDKEIKEIFSALKKEEKERTGTITSRAYESFPIHMMNSDYEKAKKVIEQNQKEGENVSQTALRILKNRL